MSGRKRKSDFLKWREKRGVSKQAAAEYFGVTVRTVERWDEDGAPVMAMKLIAYQDAHLGALHSDWAGWRITHRGELLGPGRLRYVSRQLVAMPGVLRELDRRVGSVEAQERERLRTRRRLLTEAFEEEERRWLVLRRQFLAGLSNSDLSGLGSDPFPLMEVIRPLIGES
jgi:transcriptional regulator with XRE-family HTH domain